MVHLTHNDWELLTAAWLEGSEDGQGSAFGENADTALTAVRREGYEMFAVCGDGSVLAHSRHKHYYLVRIDNGPWGVDVTTVARGILGDEVSAIA